MSFFRKKNMTASETGEMQNGTGDKTGKKRFSPKHPKRLAVIAIALAAVLGAVVIIPGMQAGKAAAASSEDLTLARTVSLTKGSLDSTVSVSGVVRSNTVSTVTTTLTSKVTAVNVAVGDKVSKGDVICTLDTTEIDKQIADKQQQIGDANKQLQDDAAKIQAQLDRAKASRTQSQTSLDATVNSATTARDNAKNALATVKTTYDGAKSSMDTANAQLAAAQKAANDAEASRATAYTAWQTAGGATPGVNESGTAEYQAWSAASTAASNAEGNLATAKTVYNYDSISKSFADADAAYKAAQDALTTAQAALDSAVNTRQSTLNDADNNIADLAAQVKTAAEKAKKGTSDSELETLREKRKSATLKAETDGEITELNVTVGSVPKDAVAKIQSTTNLILRVTIPEADINRVSVGLPVRITADSIQGTVNGTLSRISPTADTGSDSSTASSSNGYSADIAITDPAGLHIGSKAKGDIVLSTKSDVYTVPIDAVGTDVDGNSYIRSMQADGTTVNVPVTTGEKNEYNIEISGTELKEGMSVLADANWGALADSAAANMDSGVMF